MTSLQKIKTLESAYDRLDMFLSTFPGVLDDYETELLLAANDLLQVINAEKTGGAA
jgi:hypothetical protein